MTAPLLLLFAIVVGFVTTTTSVVKGFGAVASHSLLTRGRRLSNHVAPRTTTTSFHERETGVTKRATSSLLFSSSSSSEGDQTAALKEELFQLATRTKRGFQASTADRQRAKDILKDLSKLNPTLEPASSYYETNAMSSSSSNNLPTLSGKWTLIYTDAPDITSLDRTTLTATLGRIGQECSPPYIKNVIEWVRPEWAASLPFSGTEQSRILQKVVTSASASPDQPRTVNLKVAGLELEAGKERNSSNDGDDDTTKKDDWIQRIQTVGLPVGLLERNPIDLKGPLNPPFGQFEVLYLDDDFRAIRTFQNYVACNRRITQPQDEWF
jgi:hypothetical protein